MSLPTIGSSPLSLTESCYSLSGRFRIIDAGFYEPSNVIITSKQANWFKSRMSCFLTEEAFAQHRKEYYGDYSKLSKKEMTGVIMRAAVLGYRPGLVRACDLSEQDSCKE